MKYESKIRALVLGLVLAACAHSDPSLQKISYQHVSRSWAYTYRSILISAPSVLMINDSPGLDSFLFNYVFFQKDRLNLKQKKIDFSRYTLLGFFGRVDKGIEVERVYRKKTPKGSELYIDLGGYRLTYPRTYFLQQGKALYGYALIVIDKQSPKIPVFFRQSGDLYEKARVYELK